MLLTLHLCFTNEHACGQVPEELLREGTAFFKRFLRLICHLPESAPESREHSAVRNASRYRCDLYLIIDLLQVQHKHPALQQVFPLFLLYPQ